MAGIHPLLAKSQREKSAPLFEETLLGHIMKVVESFRLLFGYSPENPTNLAERWLAFFRLTPADLTEFHSGGLAACCLHDLGKGNSGFQDMVAGRRGYQAIYHEHLSGLFLWLEPFQSWLEALPAADRHVVFASVAGHHLRASSNDFAQPLQADVKRFRVFTDEIFEILDHLASHLKLYPVRLGNIDPIWSFDGKSGFDIDALCDKAKKELRPFSRETKRDARLNRLLMAVRAALILADSSGSAMVRENKNIDEWLKNAFRGSMDGNHIQENVISRRVYEIEQKRGKFIWSGFQDAAESFSRRALLLAPCGSGKTLAAWRWIKGCLNGQPKARVIFLYPTRATATEGFRDYVSWAPETDASLVTGTARFELAGMFENAVEDERTAKDFSTEDRLYALGFWDRRIFSATVDQFLGFMQQIYRSVCLLPLIADSVIVIDEVHSFDRGIFSALKLFLKNFDVPVLCMTASLPPARKNELVYECGLEAFPGSLESFPELQSGAEMPRYRIEIAEDENRAGAIAQKALDDGKRVLWVVNKVDRCQRLAREMGALCYHSRFKLEDRKKRHEAVINAFKDLRGSVFAITTQVCEMSLDLDADVLISEAAPVTSMIQRLGRCNRRAVPSDMKTGEAFFYRPDDEKPYSQEDLAGCDGFLEEVRGKTVSQVLLEELLERHGPAGIELERYSAFLEDGLWAATRDLREANDFTISALLTDEVALYFERLKSLKPVDGLLVPVPRWLAKRHPRLGNFPMVAESSHYHPDYGFFDHPLEIIV